MFRRIATAVAVATVAGGLVLTGSISATAAPVSDVATVAPQEVSANLDALTDVTREAPALPMVVTSGATGGGTKCVWVSGYGSFCSAIYWSTFERPYSKMIQSPTSKSVTSAKVVNQLCGRYSNGSCRYLGTGYTKSYYPTKAFNKRPRCGTMIWGDSMNAPYCRLGGPVYSVRPNTQYFNRAKLYINGVLKATVDSPYQTSPS